MSDGSRVIDRQINWTGLRTLLEGIELKSVHKRRQRYEEVCFPFFNNRNSENVEKVLGLSRAEGAVPLSDGYRAYAKYAAKMGVPHAQCWAHTRRHFFEAPALGLIGRI